MTLWQDTFGNRSQSGWGNASDGEAWNTLSGSDTLSVSGGEGLIAGTSSGTQVMRLGSNTGTDLDGLLRFSPGNVKDTAGLALRITDSNHYYRLDWNNGVLEFKLKNGSGSASTLRSTSVAGNAGSFYWLHFRIVGTSLYGNMWQNGLSEQPGWLLTVTDSTFASGGIGISCSLNGTGSSTDKFDSLLVASYHQLSGPVRFFQSNAAARFGPLRLRQAALAARAGQVRLRQSNTHALSGPLRFSQGNTGARSGVLRFVQDSPNAPIVRAARARFHQTVLSQKAGQVRLAMAANIPTLQYGYTILAGGSPINQNRINDIVNMTGPGSTVRFQYDAKVYFPSPDPSTWNFSVFDQTVNACNAAGLPVDIPLQNFGGVMVTTPATGNCSGKNFVLPQYMAQLAGLLAARYNNRMVSFEILNEGGSDGNAQCDLSYTADASVAGLVYLMQQGYQAIKTVNPAIKVGAPAYLPIGHGIAALTQWLTNIFKNGGGASMDYLNLHYYPNHAPDDTTSGLPSLRQVWQTFQSVAQAFGYPHLKLRITETGYARNQVSDQQQNDWTAAILKEARYSQGFIEAVYYFTVAGSNGFSMVEHNPPLEIFHPLYYGLQVQRRLFPSWPGDDIETAAIASGTTVQAARAGVAGVEAARAGTTLSAIKEP